MLIKFDMKQSRQASVLLSPSINLENEASKLLNENDHELYRQMISQMMFMMIETQINIATAVNQLSQYLVESQKVHMQAAKHLLQYLNGTIDLEIIYRPTNNRNLILYADAAYANTCKFKSITEFIALISNGPVT